MFKKQSQTFGCKWPIKFLPLVALTIAVSQGNLGCLECLFLSSDLIHHIGVRGRLLRAGTADGLAGAAVGGRLLTDGEVTNTASALSLTGTPIVDLTTDDGAFGVAFILGSTGCRSPLGPAIPPQQIPPPDQVEIIVFHADCENRFVFDANEENFVDPAAPDDVLELRDPILVPPCEE